MHDLVNPTRSNILPVRRAPIQPRRTTQPHRTTQPRCTIQSLERRTLMSGDWTTVSDNVSGEVDAMASDNMGNVYALDTYMNTISKSSDAGATWSLVVQAAPEAIQYKSIATEADGDLLVAARTMGADGFWHWQVLEQKAGQSGFAVIDDVSGGRCLELATDDVGGIFAIGSTTVTTATRGGKTTSTTYQTVRKRKAGETAFTTVDRVTGMSFSAITVIEDPSGPVDVYITATQSGGAWVVRKSGDGGLNWSAVDPFQYPTASGSPVSRSYAVAVVGDASGNVFVAGQSNFDVITGYDRRNKPIYRSEYHYVVRKSADGGASWSTDDDLLNGAAIDPQAMGTDFAGNVYVVGEVSQNAIFHGVVRSNRGGVWTTVDNYAGPDGSGAGYYAFTTDSNGKLYAGGWAYNGGLVRSAVGPAAPATATFSSTSISTSTTEPDPLLASGSDMLDLLLA